MRTSSRPMGWSWRPEWVNGKATATCRGGMGSWRTAARCSPSPTIASLLPNHLHHHPLRPSPVELAVEDLLPGAEVELAGGDGDDNFAAHDLPLEMGVGVVFPGAVVAIGERFMVEASSIARNIGLKGRR